MFSVDGADAVDSSYIVEFQGVQLDAGVVLNQFNVSGTISAANAPAFITGSRRLYAGAHRQDFTSSVLQYSDVKISSCRHWITNLSNMDLWVYDKIDALEQENQTLRQQVIENDERIVKLNNIALAATDLCFYLLDNEIIEFDNNTFLDLYERLKENAQ